MVEEVKAMSGPRGRGNDDEEGLRNRVTAGRRYDQPVQGRDGVSMGVWSGAGGVTMAIRLIMDGICGSAQAMAAALNSRCVRRCLSPPNTAHSPNNVRQS